MLTAGKELDPLDGSAQALVEWHIDCSQIVCLISLNLIGYCNRSFFHWNNYLANKRLFYSLANIFAYVLTKCDTINI